ADCGGQTGSAGDLSRSCAAPAPGRLRRAALLAGSALAGLFTPAAALAQAKPSALPINTVDVIQLAMFVGVMGAALLSAIVMIRERTRTAAENVELRARIADVHAALQRSEALLNLR